MCYDFSEAAGELFSHKIFEKFATWLSVGLSEKKYEYYLLCSRNILRI